MNEEGRTLESGRKQQYAGERLGKRREGARSKGHLGREYPGGGSHFRRSQLRVWNLKANEVNSKDCQGINNKYGWGKC